MRFTTVIATGLFAVLATAQSASENTASVTTTSLSPTASCLAACKSGDVDCQAECVGTAHPNADDANKTTECMAECDQGDGSPSAADAFAACEQSCIVSHFPIGSSAAGATGNSNTAASASATATGSSGSSSGSSASGTSSETGMFKDTPSSLNQFTN